MVSGCIVYDPILAVLGGVAMMAGKVMVLQRHAALFDHWAARDPRIATWSR